MVIAPVMMAVLTQMGMHRQRNLMFPAKTDSRTRMEERRGAPHTKVVVIVADSLIALGQALKGRSQPAAH